MIIKELLKIKREQLRLERFQKLISQRMLFELQEIKAFLELSLSKS